MPPPSILSVALANLQKSHEFLLKILVACGNLPGVHSTVSDQEMMAAITQLARLTDTVIRNGEYAREGGGDFVAADVFAEMSPPHTSPTEAFPTEDKIRRLQVILQICLEQSERNWIQAKRLKSENSVLRRGMRQVEADVVAARSLLPSVPTRTIRPAPTPPAPLPPPATPVTVTRMAGQQKLRLK
ncbi:conserved hypothetical protein [Magnetospirillum sp. SS-4]|nr:conserved hypothetical protein [Magnetospirillum sp. SS-4]